ncbi:MAG: hypothetical protein H8D42_02595 [Candidatus Marinimicrobia bacterium]|nr:hypothetical protein [Candidatus Neomarinimicrobiota bacterium]MBL7191169.1 hypothetical protein [bacterium]
MNDRSEIKLYPVITVWLKNYLLSKYKNAEISVFDTHKTNLSKFLQIKSLHRKFSEFDTFEIKTDITAVLTIKERTELVFVEVKSNPITLKDIGQLLGYCRVAKPIEAFLISPEGISTALHNLLIKYGKIDILGFEKNMIKIAKWNIDSNDIDYSSIIPRGK